MSLTSLIRVLVESIDVFYDFIFYLPKLVINTFFLILFVVLTCLMLQFPHFYNNFIVDWQAKWNPCSSTLRQLEFHKSNIHILI